MNSIPQIRLVLRLISVFLLAGGVNNEVLSDGASFTDITEESGVMEVLKLHYANVPRWWLSGIDLIDMDWDGDLDLHLAGHGHPAGAAFNDGKGHFIRKADTIAVAAKSTNWGGAVVTDFDNDGLLDWVSGRLWMLGWSFIRRAKSWKVEA